MKECRKIMEFNWDIVVEENAKYLVEQELNERIEALEYEIKENEEMLKDVITGSVTYNKIKRTIKDFKEEIKNLKKQKNEIIEDYEYWDWRKAGDLTREDWKFFIDELNEKIDNGNLWLVDESVGTWRGNFDYEIQYIGTFENFLNKATDGDIEVEVFDCKKYKKIEVIIRHHDGTNYYVLVDDIKEYLKDVKYYNNLDYKTLSWIISSLIDYSEDELIDKLLKKIKKEELIEIYENYYKDCEDCNKKQNKKELFKNLYEWAKDEFIYHLIVDYDKLNDFIEILLDFDEDTFLDYIIEDLEN